MEAKRILLLLIPFVIAILLVGRLFNQKLPMPYENYTLEQIDVSDEVIIIEGGFGGASGIGYDGCDYIIKDDSLYLKLYQQSLFSREELNGTINIKLVDDFSNIRNIYLLQPEGEPIRIWKINSINHKAVQ